MTVNDIILTDWGLIWLISERISSVANGNKYGGPQTDTTQRSLEHTFLNEFLPKTPLPNDSYNDLGC